MTRWYSEKKKEFYYNEAKRVGYRARSAFKLQQINNRFHIISPGDLVVDLGAAPGGWSQVASELVGSSGKVISVDISMMKSLEHVTFIQGDITDPVTVQAILDEMRGSRAHVVISDMAPDISGNYSVDQARSVWLCEHAFQVAEKILKAKGHFVCKIFEGADTPAFFETVKHRFQLVKKFSPDASRKSSSEVYIIARSYKG
ncbi:MAG: RlmE family RNA methyltransferase [Candidatus Thermoplasmatota archaeon]